MSADLLNLQIENLIGETKEIHNYVDTHPPYTKYTIFLCDVTKMWTNINVLWFSKRNSFCICTFS